MTDDPEEGRRVREVNERALFLRVLICGRRGGSFARGQREDSVAPMAPRETWD